MFFLQRVARKASRQGGRARTALDPGQTVHKHVAQLVLSVYIPLCRCKAVESHTLRIVLRNAQTVLKQIAQVVLSRCIPMRCCGAVESLSLPI